MCTPYLKFVSTIVICIENALKGIEIVYILKGNLYWPRSTVVTNMKLRNASLSDSIPTYLLASASNLSRSPSPTRDSLQPVTH